MHRSNDPANNPKDPTPSLDEAIAPGAENGGSGFEPRPGQRSFLDELFDLEAKHGVTLCRGGMPLPPLADERETEER